VTRGSRGPKGTLWVGQYREAEDPSGRSPDRAYSSHHRVNSFVTGVTWIDGELWHGTWEGDDSDVRRIDPQTGEALESLEMPPGTAYGARVDGGDRFFCGGGSSGKVRAVRRPKRGSAAGSVAEIPVDPASK